MVLVRKLPKEDLLDIIPEYFECVADIIRSGKRLPHEYHPANFMCESIDDMSSSEQEKLLGIIQEKLEALKTQICDVQLVLN